MNNCKHWQKFLQMETNMKFIKIQNCYDNSKPNNIGQLGVVRINVDSIATFRECIINRPSYMPYEDDMQIKITIIRMNNGDTYGVNMPADEFAKRLKKVIEQDEIFNGIDV